MAEEREQVAEEEEEEAEPGPAWPASSALAGAAEEEEEEEVVSVQGSAWEPPARGVSHHQTCRRSCDTSDRGVSECGISWSLDDLLESLDRKKQHAVMLAPFPCCER